MTICNQNLTVSVERGRSPVQHIFIINPHAGKKDQTGRIYEMADRLRQHGLTCQCLLTQRSGGAEEIARRLVSSGERSGFTPAAGTAL